MPWWSWIVIWIALVALSLLFFVVLGARLFRKFMATVKELGEAGERFSTFPSAAAASADSADGPGAVIARADGAAGTEPTAEPGSAVFASPIQMGHDYRAAKFARQEARRRRRVQRKLDRGQPQRLHDIELS